MALDPLATIDDLTVRMRLTIADGADTDRAEALLVDASAEVRAHTGQTISAVSTTDRLKVTNRIIRLPQRPATDVTAVTDINGEAVMYEWQSGELLTVAANVPDSFAWEPWVNGLVYVDVTYDHGYDPVPDEIIAIVCQMAARAYGRPAEDSGMTSETVAGYSYSVGAAAAAGGVGLLPDEIKKLNRYTRPVGMARFG